MPGAVRVGDINEAGGIAVLGSTDVIINGRPAAMILSPVTPHPCCGAPGCDAHCAAVIIGPGSPSVMVNGKPMIVQGDVDSCGHLRLTCSTDVIAPGGSSLLTAGLSIGIGLAGSGFFSPASAGPVAKAGSFNPALKS